MTKDNSTSHRSVGRQAERHHDVGTQEEVWSFPMKSGVSQETRRSMSGVNSNDPREARAVMDIDSGH